MEAQHAELVLVHGRHVRQAAACRVLRSEGRPVTALVRRQGCCLHSGGTWKGPPFGHRVYVDKAAVCTAAVRGKTAVCTGGT